MSHMILRPLSISQVSALFRDYPQRLLDMFDYNSHAELVRRLHERHALLMSAGEMVNGQYQTIATVLISEVVPDQYEIGYFGHAEYTSPFVVLRIFDAIAMHVFSIMGGEWLYAKERATNKVARKILERARLAPCGSFVDEGIEFILHAYSRKDFNDYVNRRRLFNVVGNGPA